MDGNESSFELVLDLELGTVAEASTVTLTHRKPNRCTFGSRAKFLAIEDEFEVEDEHDFLGFWRRNSANNENKFPSELAKLSG